MDPIRSQQLLLVQDGDFDLSAPNDPTASAQKVHLFPHPNVCSFLSLFGKGSRRKEITQQIWAVFSSFEISKIL
jgi:hypothetical protein